MAGFVATFLAILMDPVIIGIGVWTGWRRRLASSIVTACLGAGVIHELLLVSLQTTRSFNIGMALFAAAICLLVALLVRFLRRSKI